MVNNELLMMAVNPETPYTVLESLSHNSCCRVLERLAENRSTPAHVLTHLAAHEEPSVRAAVTDNPNIPVDLLWRLAKDECVDVRYQIAENCNAPFEIIEHLVLDDNPYVAMRAEKTLRKLETESRERMPMWDSVRAFFKPHDVRKRQA